MTAKHLIGSIAVHRKKVSFVIYCQEEWKEENSGVFLYLSLPFCDQV